MIYTMVYDDIIYIYEKEKLIYYAKKREREEVYDV